MTAPSEEHEAADDRPGTRSSATATPDLRYDPAELFTFSVVAVAPEPGDDEPTAEDEPIADAVAADDPADAVDERADAADERADAAGEDAAVAEDEPTAEETPAPAGPSVDGHLRVAPPPWSAAMAWGIGRSAPAPVAHDDERDRPAVDAAVEPAPESAKSAEVDEIEVEADVESVPEFAEPADVIDADGDAIEPVEPDEIDAEADAIEPVEPDAEAESAPDLESESGLDVENEAETEPDAGDASDDEPVDEPMATVEDPVEDPDEEPTDAAEEPVSSEDDDPEPELADEAELHEPDTDADNDTDVEVEADAVSAEAAASGDGDDADASGVVRVIAEEHEGRTLEVHDHEIERRTDGSVDRLRIEVLPGEETSNDFVLIKIGSAVVQTALPANTVIELAIPRAAGTEIRAGGDELLLGRLRDLVGATESAETAESSDRAEADAVGSPDAEDTDGSPDEPGAAPQPTAHDETDSDEAGVFDQVDWDSVDLAAFLDIDDPDDERFDAFFEPDLTNLDELDRPSLPKRMGRSIRDRFRRRPVTSTLLLVGVAAIVVLATLIPARITAATEPPVREPAESMCGPEADDANVWESAPAGGGRVLCVHSP